MKKLRNARVEDCKSCGGGVPISAPATCPSVKMNIVYGG